MTPHDSVCLKDYQERRSYNEVKIFSVLTGGDYGQNPGIRLRDVFGWDGNVPDYWTDAGGHDVDTLSNRQFIPNYCPRRLPDRSAAFAELPRDRHPGK